MKCNLRVIVAAPFSASTRPVHSAAIRRRSLLGGVAHVRKTSCCGNHSLYLSSRTYFWPYPENLVPSGQSTSHFHSSSVRSERERVISEYALSPLFGARIPCCILGLQCSPSQVLAVKPALRAALSCALNDPASHAKVELGSTIHTKDMMLYRGGDALSPRLGDGAGARPDSARRRCTRYARAPVAARTLVEVFLTWLDDNCTAYAEYVHDSDSAEDVLDAGRAIQTAFYACTSAEQKAQNGAQVGPDSHSGAVVVSSRLMHDPVGVQHAGRESGGVKHAEMHDDMEHEDEDGRKRLRVCVRQLRELGVVYCEVPALDEGGFVFDQLHGRDVDESVGSAIVDRWEQRMASSSSMGKGYMAKHNGTVEGCEIE